MKIIISGSQYVQYHLWLRVFPLIILITDVGGLFIVSDGKETVVSFLLIYEIFLCSV